MGENNVIDHHGKWREHLIKFSASCIFKTPSLFICVPLALIQDHGGNCALCPPGHFLCSKYILDKLKELGLIQEADLQLEVCYLDKSNPPGSHHELAPFSVCADGWISPK